MSISSQNNNILKKMSDILQQQSKILERNKSFVSQGADINNLLRPTVSVLHQISKIWL